MIGKSLKWMLHRDSPLYIRPEPSLGFVRFMLGMWKSSNGPMQRAGFEAHLRLAQGTIEAYEDYRADGIDFELRHDGLLMAFTDQENLDHDRQLLDLAERYDREPQVLIGDDVRNHEPLLSDRVHGGIFFPKEQHVDPNALMRSLHRRLIEGGVRILENAPLAGVRTERERITEITAGTERLAADAYVLAAGAWTGPLSRLIGVPLPVRPGKGYSIDVDPFPLRSSTNLSDAKVAVTPLTRNLRLAGTMEFGGLDEELNQIRIGAILRRPSVYFRDWTPPATGHHHAAGGHPPDDPRRHADHRPTRGAEQRVRVHRPRHAGHHPGPGSALALTALVLRGETPDVLIPFTPPGSPAPPRRSPHCDPRRSPRSNPFVSRRSVATKLTLEAIEVHAEGEPGRVITSAADLVKGKTMAERFDYCRARSWTTCVCYSCTNPADTPSQCAVFVLPPVNAGSAFGVVVLEQGGFTPMSGSNTMCTVTAMLESGRVPMVEPVTEVRINTAVGTVTTLASVSGGKVTSVTVVNVPAFVVGLDVVLDVPEFGAVGVDIVFGGQFFVQARAADFGLDIDPSHARELTRAAALLKMAAAEQLTVQHPLNPSIDHVEPGHAAHRRPRPRSPRPQRDRADQRHDPPRRAPDVDGRARPLALRHRHLRPDGRPVRPRAAESIGEAFRHRSIIGSEFVGELTGTTTVGPYAAVLPRVTGRAWVTGYTRWVLDDTDPFPTGYTVGDIWAPQPT